MFNIGEIYRRRDLHTLYGGQPQGGISTPANHPFIMIFTADSGEQYGYKDSWQSNSTFHYTGEGQRGDMTFIRGNRAIRDHVADGKAIYLFEAAHASHVRYVHEMIYRSHEIMPGVDVDDQPRAVIVFTLEVKSPDSSSRST